MISIILKFLGGLIPAPYRIYAYVIIAVLTFGIIFGAGWRIHSIYDAYQVSKNVQKVEKKETQAATIGNSVETQYLNQISQLQRDKQNVLSKLAKANANNHCIIDVPVGWVSGGSEAMPATAGTAASPESSAGTVATDAKDAIANCESNRLGAFAERGEQIQSLQQFYNRLRALYNK